MNQPPIHPIDARQAERIATLLDDVESEILARQIYATKWVAPEAQPWLLDRAEAAKRE